jgi:hypothetical protein
VTQDRRLISPAGSRVALLCAPAALVLCLLLPSGALGRQLTPPPQRCRPAAAHCSLAGRLAAAELRRTRHPARAHTHAATPAFGGSGSIEGTVTSALGKAGLPGIEVCAYEREALEAGAYAGREPDCTTIEEASGAYRIGGLTAGGYLVEFFDGQRNYVTQFWHGSVKPEQGLTVPVSDEASTSGIDAEMLVGGHVEGILAGDGKPLAGVFACWAEPELEGLGQGCTPTDSEGHYLITGLATGTYHLGFIVPRAPGLNYLSQFAGPEVEAHVNQTSLVETVELLSGGQIEGKVTAASSGVGLAGIQVTAWGLHSPPESTFTARGGVYKLERLRSDEYEVEFIDIGETYLRQFFAEKAEPSEATLVNVVAGQLVGGIDAVLHTVAPEPAPPSPPVTPPVTPTAPTKPRPLGTVLPSKVVAPSLTVGSRVHVAGRNASVKIACAAGSCNGTLRLLATIVHRHRVKGHTVKRSVTILLGSGSFSLSQGGSVKSKLTLSAAGRKLFAGAAHHPRAAKLKVGLSGLATIVHAVTVD